MKFFNAIKQHFHGLAKSRLFWASLAIYISIPLLGYAIYTSDTPMRTSGVYQYFENGELATEIELKDNGTVSITYFFETPISRKDKEYTYKDKVRAWTFRESDWYKNEAYEGFEHLTRQYILFENDKHNAYFILFKDGKNLYTDYLVDEDRGGGQKCYTKK